MNYIQIDKASISNGPGWRVVLWVSGCTLKCQNCHNPEAQDFNAGKQFDENAKKFLFEQLDKPYIKGITLSGGHPFEKSNRSTIYCLVKEIKEKFPQKDIWMYTGYTWEEIFEKDIREIQRTLCWLDVLVDGPYIEEQRDITLPFRGSKNQRLIDVQATLEQNKIILYNTTK